MDEDTKPTRVARERDPDEIVDEEDNEQEEIEVDAREQGKAAGATNAVAHSTENEEQMTDDDETLRNFFEFVMDVLRLAHTQLYPNMHLRHAKNVCLIQLC